MNANKRRIEADSDLKAVNTSMDVTLELNQSDAVNVHGLHWCVSIEPEVGDANANGFWAVWCLPGQGISVADLPDTFAELGSEDFAPYLWGTGCWTASNQSTFNERFSPKTSRNCQSGARIVARVRVTGLSSGNVRVNQILSAFTTS